MHHVHIVYSEKDRSAAFWLSNRLKWYYHTHRQTGSAVIDLDGALFSPNPEDQNFLVIVCSFHTVEDPTIAEAIRRFYEKEPLSHIIPYTISGIPCASNPIDECLPKILSEISQNDLLAINSVVLTKRAAIQKVVSTVHDIPLSVLEQRNKKRARLRAFLIGLLCLVFLLYAFWSEYSTDSHMEYYRTFTYSNGIPVGIDRLSLPERIFRDSYYRFRVNYKDPLSIQRVGEPEGVRAEDSDLQAFYDAIDTPYIEFSYHTDGTLDAAVHKDDQGNILFVMNYCSGSAAVDFSELPDGISPYFLTLDGEGTNFSRCLFEYDAAGQLTNIRYFTNSRNEP